MGEYIIKERKYGVLEEIIEIDSQSPIADESVGFLQMSSTSGYKHRAGDPEPKKDPKPQILILHTPHLLPPLMADRTTLNREKSILSMFIIIWFLISTVALILGIVNKSHPLLAEAFHSLFHSIAAIFTLLAIKIALEDRRSRTYSYGYRKIEVIAAFGNAISIFFTGLFVIGRAIHQTEAHQQNTHDDFQHAQHQRLLATYTKYISGLRMIICFLFIAILRRYLESKCRRLQKWTSHHDNMHSFSLVLILVLLTCCFDYIWIWLDPSDPEMHLIHIFISVTITIISIFLTLPVFVSAARNLVMAIPRVYLPLISKLRGEVEEIKGVISVDKFHFWAMDLQNIVGTICISSEEGSDEGKIIHDVKQLFAWLTADMTIQCRRGLNSKLPEINVTNHMIQ